MEEGPPKVMLAPVQTAEKLSGVIKNCEGKTTTCSRIPNEI